mgnify:CR=1 FL=1
MLKFKYELHDKKGKVCRSVFRIAGFTIIGVTIAIGFAALFGYFVMLLWNYLMPMIFGLKTITFLQAVALIILAKLIFGNFGHSGHKHDHHHNKVNDKWHKWMGFSDNDSEIDVAEEHHKEFHEFWKLEGKSAFDEFIKRKQEEEK